MDKNKNKEEEKGSAQRFEFLMERYLAGNATPAEEGEFLTMVKNGFDRKFKDRIDREYTSKHDLSVIPPNIREQILGNILGEEVGEPVRPVRRLRWAGWAAAVILTVGTAIGLVLLKKPADRENATVAKASSERYEGSGTVVLTGRQFARLPDGSTVLMNDGSQLEYLANDFENGKRVVTLTGEAYFDVVRNSESTFTVLTDQVTTRVLGTAFNINTEEKTVTVTVERGLVEVSGRKGVYAELKRNEQITVNKETDEYASAMVSAEEEILWKSSCLVFDNVDLKQVSVLFRSRYGGELTFTNQEVLNCRVTASFLNGEDADTVVRILSEMMGGSYRVEGNNATVTGGSCI